MNLYQLIVALLALFIMVTAAARLHDILTKKGALWMVRKIGMSCVVVAMGMIAVSPFVEPAKYWFHITVFLAMLGWAMTWATTPNERPWWELLRKYDPDFVDKIVR